MTQSVVPVLVLSARQEDAELVNQTLREAGHRAQCLCSAGVDKLGEILEARNPHLIVLFADTLDVEVATIAGVRRQFSTPIPLIVVRDTVDENTIMEMLEAGAQDLVSTGQRERLKSVANREIRTYRLERALNRTLESASQYKAQLKSFMAGSVDAIAQIQEGIVVDANQTWADLLGYDSPESMHGPVMDFVGAGSQAVLKGALLASMKGKWNGEPLKIDALHREGSPVSVEISLEQTLFDGEPSIKLTVRRPEPQADEPESIVERTVHADPVSGFSNRAHFIELLMKKLVEPASSGARALALIRIDKFRQIQEDVGVLASEEVVAQTAEIVRGLLAKSDICGRFAGTTFAVVLERGALRDVHAWAEHVTTRVAESIIEVSGKTTAITCTIGIAEFGPDTAFVEPLISTADRAAQRGRAEGGDRVVVEEASDESTQIKRLDALWGHQIKSALMEDRFRLVHLGIASLSGPALGMQDTVLRMIDQQGDEMSASQFMDSAQRNGLSRPIDRWVIGASISYCAKQECGLLFIKLSADSIADEEIVDWMAKQCREKQVDPSRLCVEIAEVDAARILKQSQSLGAKLRAAGFRFAIEHFGVGRDPVRLLNQLDVDYVKIDGSLMQTVASDPASQDNIKAMVAAAKHKNVATIAERVDDANTMAVLFQLGIAYMQGYYVHEPEVVLSETA